MYPILAKTTVNGEVHQLLYREGDGNCRVYDAISGQEITKKNLNAHELEAMSMREGMDKDKGKDKSLVLEKKDGRLKVIDRPLSASESTISDRFMEEDRSVVFLVAPKRLSDNSFSRKAPDGGRGRIPLKRVPAMEPSPKHLF